MPTRLLLLALAILGLVTTCAANNVESFLKAVKSQLISDLRSGNFAPQDAPLQLNSFPALTELETFYAKQLHSKVETFVATNNPIFDGAVSFAIPLPSTVEVLDAEISYSIKRPMNSNPEDVLITLVAEMGKGPDGNIKTQEITFGDLEHDYTRVKEKVPLSMAQRWVEFKRAKVQLFAARSDGEDRENYIVTPEDFDYFPREIRLKLRIVEKVQSVCSADNQRCCRRIIEVSSSELGFTTESGRDEIIRVGVCAGVCSNEKSLSKFITVLKEKDADGKPLMSVHDDSVCRATKTQTLSIPVKNADGHFETHNVINSFGCACFEKP